MKRFFVLTSLLASFSAMAIVPEVMLSNACREDIERVLKKHGSRDRWTRTIDPAPGVFAFRSPTKTIGKWVEIQTYPNPSVFYYDAQVTKVYEWDGKKCIRTNETTHKPQAFVVSKKQGFTDKKLIEIASSQKPSLIYVWSPMMVYSMSEMKVFRQVAKELEMDFIPLLDPFQDVANSKKLISGYEPDLEVVKLQSLDLVMREASVHFPASYVVGFDRVSNRIFGVMEPDQLKEKVLDELAFIKRVDK